MRKISILIILFALCNYISAYEPEDVLIRKELEVKNKLEALFHQIVSKNLTEESLMDRYGKPDEIKILNGNYLNDYYKVYCYESLGEFDFYYKTDENKLYFNGFKIFPDFFEMLPRKIEEVDSLYDCILLRFYNEKSDVTFLFYAGEFTMGFAFKNNNLQYVYYSYGF